MMIALVLDAQRRPLERERRRAAATATRPRPQLALI